ncbi:unnamed protein product, partial [marine sediment metagenome]
MSASSFKTLKLNLLSTAVETASKSLHDLRIAEVVELDLQLENG